MFLVVFSVCGRIFTGRNMLVMTPTFPYWPKAIRHIGKEWSVCGTTAIRKLAFNELFCPNRNRFDRLYQFTDYLLMGNNM